MDGVFAKDRLFNIDISSWNISRATTMTYLFSDTAFNQDITAWDVSNVEDLSEMFV